MKKVSLLFIAACCSLLASAQKVYFLYFQTEDQTPFYVRMGEKIYSSAASGFLILSNLPDTTYYLNIGFAKSVGPETRFSVAVNQTDRGFLIKKFEEGLALFDLEELSVVKSAATQKDTTVYETKSDAFSNILSKAAGDPSIVKVPVVKKEEKPAPVEKEEVTAKIEEKKPAEPPAVQNSNTTPTGTKPEATLVSDSAVAKTNEKTDTSTQKQPPSDTPAIQQPQPGKEEEAPQQASYKPSVVSRHSESSTTEGFGVIYFDKSEEGTDTIRVLIPASKTKPETEVEPTPTTDGPIKEEKIDSLAEAKKGEIESKAKEAQPSFTEEKSTCKNTATDKDFLKLRKRMAAGDTDEEMIGEAKKEFRSKCYSVEQLRYLSTLFLTSAAKYQFFDAAYNHVSDKSNFNSLGSEIKDDYYAKRFKALVGE